VILLKNFKNMFRIPELMNKLLFTLGVLVVFRIGSFIPVAGVNITALTNYMEKAAGLAGLLKYLDVLSAGALTQCTLFALGIGPYITASIIMQVLSMGGMQYLEQLYKEGEYGRKLINQYTRYLTIGIALLWSTGYTTMLENNNLVLTPGIGFRLFFILSVTTGAVVVMWLGEQISLRGLSNGSSVLIFASIVARLPANVIKTMDAAQKGFVSPTIAWFVLFFFIAVAAAIIYLEKGERKIPVQYARRVIGQRVYAGQNTYIPFKINTVGVMPAIFASTTLQIPMYLCATLASRWDMFRILGDWLHPQGFLYDVLIFILIVFFSYAYTAMIFKPSELADNMKKSGGFIPGIRPGRSTADYFDYILTRIGLVGAVYLGILVLLPNVLHAFVSLPFMMSGTSLLIMVGVALEFSSQIESYLIEHNYGSFLITGRLKNRG
jgi:preprotein translocase subunit SecY